MTIQTDVRFAMIPEWVMNHPDISGNDLLVYVALSMRANHKKNNTCWPGHEKIGEDVGLSVNTVRRSLAALRKAGAVSWEEREGASHLYTVYMIQQQDSSSVGTPKIAPHPQTGTPPYPEMGTPPTHTRVPNNTKEQEEDNKIITTRQAEEQTEVKTNFEEFPVRQQTEISAADWDDSPETRNQMAQRIAKEFYVALKSTKNKRPAVKHKQMVALIDDLIERGYTEDEIGQIFSAHYKSKSPWTLNSIAFTEAKINEEKESEWKPGRSSILDRVLGAPDGD